MVREDQKLIPSKLYVATSTTTNNKKQHKNSLATADDTAAPKYNVVGFSCSFFRLLRERGWGLFSRAMSVYGGYVDYLAGTML
jgi:hypothetical protein